MSTPILRRRVTASALACAAVFALGACGTSFSAQTNQQYQAAEGANARGDVDAMNTVVVADEAGTGVVSVGLVNKTDAKQTLTGITITTADGSKIAVSAPAADVEIGPGDIVTLGSSDELAFRIAEGAEAGDYVTISFAFSDARATEVKAPTVMRNHTYESVVASS